MNIYLQRLAGVMFALIELCISMRLPYIYAYALIYSFNINNFLLYLVVLVGAVVKISDLDSKILDDEPFLPSTVYMMNIQQCSIYHANNACYRTH